MTKYLSPETLKWLKKKGALNEAVAKELIRDVEQLHKEREKLIDSIGYAIKFMDHVPLTDARTAMAYTNLKDTLKEIGVNQS